MRATVHVSHECACLSSLERVVWRHMQSFLSSKGHKKRSCRRGERPLLCEPSTPAGSWVRKRFPRGGAVPFLSVLTFSTTVREPPHRLFPCPSDSPPRPRRKHRPCPAICLKIVFLHQTRILVSLVVLIADAFPILIPAIEFVTSVSSMVQFVLKKEVYMDKANYKLGVMGNLAARFRRILSA